MSILSVLQYVEMHLPATLLAAAILLPSTLAQATFQRSSKRGLVFVASTHPQDDQIWVESGSDLTWYYNYGPTPTSAYTNLTQSEFDFVPMLWGAPSSTSDTSFLTDVKQMISSGMNISHVLTFNEPDGTLATGGSDVEPSLAASTWIREIEPLRKLGVQTGAPAVTGSPDGFTWLSEFFGNCTSQGTNCTADFIPIHWYGNFEGLASHLGQVVATYPNTSIWITEYALNDGSLADSQSFFNSSAEYFDRLSYVDRYSYFGSFRSSVSNIGPNAAMLDSKGRLTSIGSWYLGGGATKNIPSSSTSVVIGFGINSMWAATVLALATICLV